MSYNIWTFGTSGKRLFIVSEENQYEAAASELSLPSGRTNKHAFPGGCWKEV